MKSIKTKLIVYFSILLLIAATSTGLITLKSARKILTEEAEEKLLSMATDGSKLTASCIETQIRTIETITLLEDIQGMDWEIQKSILKGQVEKTDFLNMGIVNLDGTTNFLDGTTKKIGDKEYVKKALEGETNVSDLLIDNTTSQTTLIYAAPIKKGGKVVGALLGIGDGNYISDVIAGISNDEDIHTYISNGDGTIIAHPDKNIVLSRYNPIEEAKNDEKLATLAKERLMEKTGVGKYTFKGKEMYAGYTPIEGTDWIIVVSSYISNALKGVSILRERIIRDTLTNIICGIVIVYFIGRTITKPIIKGVNYSEQIANFDVSQDIPEDFLKRKDETGVLANSLQKIINNLRDIINDVDKSSEQVVATSEELTATTQQSATAAEEISKTAEEISRGASDQAKNTEEGASNAILLGETIEKDIEYKKELSNASNRVIEVINEGLLEIENLSNIIEESNNAAKEIRDVILRTNESSNNIGQASNVISSIAEQTNLLALNAAIEAARAGETGRGFAVVAEEIRKLAEESQSSTEDINEIVSELQSNAENAVRTIEIVGNIVNEQTKSVVSSKDKYVLISEAMKDTEKAVEQLNISGEKMGNMKNIILDTLENLSAIAEENSAATQQVTAAIEEQTASIEEIANANEGLTNLAQDLQLVIKKFNV